MKRVGLGNLLTIPLNNAHFHKIKAWLEVKKQRWHSFFALEANIFLQAITACQVEVSPWALSFSENVKQHQIQSSFTALLRKFKPHIIHLHKTPSPNQIQTSFLKREVNVIVSLMAWLTENEIRVVKKQMTSYRPVPCVSLCLSQGGRKQSNVEA